MFKELRYAARTLLKRPGFSLVAVFTLAPSRYEREEERAAFFQQLIDRLKLVPGIENAGAVLTLPLSGAFESTDAVLDGQKPSSFEQSPEADYTIVTANYFETLQIPLLTGRHFNAHDKRDAPRVIVINEILAQRLWPGEDAIGKRFRAGFEKQQREVIGVVGNIKQTTLDAAPRPAMYLPHSQAPNSGMTLLVRTKGEPLSMAAVVREEVRAIDKDVPVAEVQTMEKIIGKSVAQPRFSMLVVGLFALLALVLLGGRHLRRDGLLRVAPRARDRSAHGPGRKR
jgi:putative ABC transport system permease protein